MEELARELDKNKHCITNGIETSLDEALALIVSCKPDVYVRGVVDSRDVCVDHPVVPPHDDSYKIYGKQ